MRRIHATTLCLPTRFCMIERWRRGLTSVSLQVAGKDQKRLSSSNRWKARQRNDSFTREAAVQGLKSRAAFKLLQIDSKYKLFSPGQTVVDLGYAPGSWSQVALSRTQPNGRVLGVDIIPATPPKGMSTIQGNFLSPEVQAYVREFLRDRNRGRPRLLESSVLKQRIPDFNYDSLENRQDYERNGNQENKGNGFDNLQEKRRGENQAADWTVDVVLSDMSAPWAQTRGFWKRSLSDPYYRMMNTSGVGFRDHSGSMDLCRAALQFSYNVLKNGGHFVCKFYQGPEDKTLETQLKELFENVHRIKPESSRNESREAFFVATSRKVTLSESPIL